MKVYTKTGDDGTTSLIGGQRVDKCDLRVEAYGTVDELTAFAALLTDCFAEEHLTEPVGQLRRIISQLMNVAALLATGDSARDKIKPIDPMQTACLEEWIDTMQATLPPITKFTIPGGHTAVSLCHVCRTVCRRAACRPPIRRRPFGAAIPQSPLGLLLCTRPQGGFGVPRRGDVMDTIAPICRNYGII